MPPTSYVLQVAPEHVRGIVKGLSAPRNPVDALARTRTQAEKDRALAINCGPAFIAQLAKRYPTVWTKDRVEAALIPSTKREAA